VKCSAYFITTSNAVQRENVHYFTVEVSGALNLAFPVIQHFEESPLFTRRFGGLPALKVGVIYIVWFGHKSKWKLSFHAAENVATKNGICDLTALNLGQFLVMREVIRTPQKWRLLSGLTWQIRAIGRTQRKPEIILDFSSK
jgi:hypothetical protein